VRDFQQAAALQDHALEESHPGESTALRPRLPRVDTVSTRASRKHQAKKLGGMTR
jgi:hypothetical protein